MNLLPTATATSSIGLTIPSGHIPFSSQLYRRKHRHIRLNGDSTAAEEKAALGTSRRIFTFCLLFPIPFALSAASSATLPPTLERYTDEVNGFSLLKPSTWTKFDKAGAQALFEDGEGSNNIGVVVTPVRLSSLTDFGTLQFVAEKLIQAERRKVSTNYAELLTVSERLDNGGLPVYEFEYTVDSTRGGMKRIFSAAFVASKKLYLLNISYCDRPENPLDGETRRVLKQILRSFDSVL
uniref:PsbP domain-OEC23 like protein n=1 Tax=Habenaria pantlingiana TaxID=1498489 RepID=A0A0F7GYU9_9ASPA